MGFPRWNNSSPTGNCRRRGRIVGRPSRALDPDQGALAQFAEQLRQLRSEAGSPTYQAMANRSGRSKEALAAAARGLQPVSWETVDAFVLACGGNPAEWKPRYLSLQQQLTASEKSSDGGDPEAGGTSAERLPSPEPVEAQALTSDFAAGETPALMGLRRWDARPARGRRPVVWVAVPAVAAVAAVIGVGAISAEQGPANVRRAARAEEGAPGGDGCDQWWPKAGEPAYGWAYRACMRPDPLAPGRWIPGAEVRNLGGDTASVEVYVSWVRVPGAGGANQNVGHLSVDTGPVAAGAVGRVSVAAVAHPGSSWCLWTEVAPLITPQQRWSDSPKTAAKGGLCPVQ